MIDSFNYINKGLEIIDFKISQKLVKIRFLIFQSSNEKSMSFGFSTLTFYKITLEIVWDKFSLL